MRAEAIVYTSRTGHTRQYAHLLGEALGLPVQPLEENGLPRGSAVLYLGWLCASRVKGYRRAAGRYRICAVCGVGLCDTGTMTGEVRRATAIPDSIPLFTLQGGIDRDQLSGLNRLLIDLLTKGLTDQKQRSVQDERILELLNTEGSFVSRENLTAVLDWYGVQSL